MEQLVARKDGWVAAGWRKKDPVISVIKHVISSADGGEPTLAVVGP